MSHFNQVQRSYLFVLLFGLLLLLSQAACTTPQRTAFAQVGQVMSNEIDQSLEESAELVFAGQIEDENGRWLNNCVVVLFKNGEEVTRTTTRLMESSFSNNGPMDGVFELRTPNIYKLSLVQKVYYPNRVIVPMSTVPGMVGTRFLGTWFDDLNPADMRILNVPDKQLEYAVVVLPMPQDELPDSYAPGKLTFQGGMLVTKQVGAVGTDNVPSPIPVPHSNVKFTVLPSQNNGQDWHLQMTGYFGNRWDVWEKYVGGRGTSLSWEAFQYSVLVHNPHLESDGFVFYPDKVYLLPFNE